MKNGSWGIMGMIKMSNDSVKMNTSRVKMLNVWLWLNRAYYKTKLRETNNICKSEISSCSAIDLAEIWRSPKISSWIWSIISGVVTVFGRPGRSASQVEKSPCLNWATQFLTVAYDGSCSPNVSIRMAWISFGALPCRKKKHDSSRLDVVEIARVAWHASFLLL